MVKMYAFIMQNYQNSLFLASSIKRFPNSVKKSNFPLFNQFLLSKKIGQQQSVLYIQSFLYSDGFYIQFALWCQSNFINVSIANLELVGVGPYRKKWVFWTRRLKNHFNQILHCIQNISIILWHCLEQENWNLQ